MVKRYKLRYVPTGEIWRVLEYSPTGEERESYTMCKHGRCKVLLDTLTPDGYVTIEVNNA